MKNQTREEYKQSGKLGVGLVLKEEGGGYKKYVLHDKTYEEVIEIGDEHVAFKFLPYGIEAPLKGKMFVLNNGIPDEMFMCGEGQCST